MNAQIEHEVTETGIRFTCLDKATGERISISSWAKFDLQTQRGPGSIGELILLTENEDAKAEDETLILVPHDKIASLEHHHLQQLGLPDPMPYRLSISGNGIVTESTFLFQYRFIHPAGRPLMGAVRHGTILKVGEKSYTLLDPFYTLLDSMDRFNGLSPDQMDDRFLEWARLKEVLPDDVVVEEYLKTMNIARADSFTLRLFDKENLNFSPELVRKREVIQPELFEDEKDPFDPSLPDDPQDAFAVRFREGNRAEARYALGGSWYLIVPPALQKALAVVHKMQKAPVEQRLAFAANPRTFLSEALEELFDEQVIDNLFYESPEYLSDRIDHIGIWEPKRGAFIFRESREWLPPEHLGEATAVAVPLGDKLIRVDIDDIPKVLGDLSEAISDGAEHIEYKGQKIPATEEARQAVSLGISELQPDQLDKDDSPEEREQKAKEVLVPIIKDNLDELEHTVDARPGRNSAKGIPAVLKESTKLYEHQIHGINWLQDHWSMGNPGSLLADDMGLGKTLQALVFLAWVQEQMEYERHPRRPFLIVAPTGLLKNWEDEEVQHLSVPGLGEKLKAHGLEMRGLFIEHRGDETRIARELDAADWMLTTYETLRDKIGIFVKVHWAVVIFDEVQKIKNPSALMTDMAKSLKADMTVAMTGTPVENRLQDLWCIIDTVHPGKLGPLKKFNNQYESRRDSSEASRELRETLQEGEKPALLLRRLKVDHLDGLPDKEVIPITRMMPPVQAIRYQEVVSEARQSSPAKGKMLKILGQLRSVSLHPEVASVEGVNEGYIAQSARLTSLFEKMDEIAAKGEKALIFVESLGMQAVLAPYFQARYHLDSPPMIINGTVTGDQRKRRVDLFQNPSRQGFDVMLLSPKAGGVGLTLTAANHVLHLSRWWNPAVEDQCTDRIYRIGQDKKVYIYYLIAQHPDYPETSFDTKLDQLLEEKRRLSWEVLAPSGSTKADYENLYRETVET